MCKKFIFFSVNNVFVSLLKCANILAMALYHFDCPMLGVVCSTCGATSAK